MTESKRVFITAVLIMGFVAFLTTASSVLFLYHTAVDEQKERLLEVVKSRARLLEVVYDTLEQHNIDEVNNGIAGNRIELGDIFARLTHSLSLSPDTAASKRPVLNFIVAEKRGAYAQFIVGTRKLLKGPVPVTALAGKPMGMALEGVTGVLKTRDHMGNPILSSYTYVPTLRLGIVAKIFLDDLRRPFIKTALYTYIGAIILFFGGGLIMRRTVSPLVRKLENTRDDLQNALGEVKSLSGLLPICAACKKIRDDQGYWKQIESYIKDHSEAEFSHSICPECVERLYPDLDRPGD